MKRLLVVFLLGSLVLDYYVRTQMRDSYKQQAHVRKNQQIKKLGLKK